MLYRREETSYAHAATTNDSGKSAIFLAEEHVVVSG